MELKRGRKKVSKENKKVPFAISHYISTENLKKHEKALFELKSRIKMELESSINQIINN
jgi:hypothetical protein